MGYAEGFVLVVDCELAMIRGGGIKLDEERGRDGGKKRGMGA